MKTKLLVFFLFIIYSNSIFSQQQEYFFSLDGRKYKTERGRDNRENKFWEENFQYIELMNEKGHFEGKDKQEIKANFIELFNTQKSYISMLRSISAIIPKESYADLRKLGLATEAYASTGELFPIKELQESFDIMLSLISYQRNLCKSLSTIDSKDANIEDIFEDVAKRFSEIHEEFSEKNKASLDALEKIRPYLNGETKDISKTNNSNSSDVIYFAIDGTSYTSENKRDEYEEALFDDILIKIKNNPKRFEDKERFDLLCKGIPIIAKNSSFTRTLEKMYVTKNPSPKNKVKYYANNNEPFSNIDIRDSLNYIIGLYEILLQTANDVAIHKKEITTLGFYELTDSYGNKYVDLFSQYTEKVTYIMEILEIK